MSLVVFDSTGIDEYVLSVVLYVAVPATIMTVTPATVAARRYTGRRAALASICVFTAAALAAYLTAGFFVVG
ncbi:hypothetical protein [Haladaptatus sp. DYSN1]|uniref:hypothetical protein n=1 Tax=unclassified Haladaptatus TaxID=2622732 RepID=UPI0024057F2F|nr:hypothetical protein [Haladaptatus sp. DYSN1]